MIKSFWLRSVFWYACLSVVFVLLVLLPEPDVTALTRHHLEAWPGRLFGLAFLVLEAMIWLAAFYGAAALRRYGRMIHTSPDGQAVSRLAAGMLVFAIGLPVVATVAAALSILTTYHPSLNPASIILINYAATAFPLLAILWISAGARRLGQLSKTRPPLAVFNLVILNGVILGTVFCAIVSLNGVQLHAVYHMSPVLVMLTIGVPFIYTWFLGLFAVAELRAHSLRVRGVVYRKSWRLLAMGITATILLSILLQYVTALSAWLALLPLGWILVLLYVLLLLLALAFIVVALGAQRLAKIEEV